MQCLQKLKILKILKITLACKLNTPDNSSTYLIGPFYAGPNAALIFRAALIRAGVKNTENNRSIVLSIVLFTDRR